jgi:hypothetical protein
VYEKTPDIDNKPRNEFQKKKKMDLLREGMDYE